MPSSPSQKIYHHLVKCQHHNCHCYVCYHDQHLPLNFIAFSVSKSPLPSTCTPTSSSFRYTWILSQYNDDHNEDDLAVRADCEICCCAGSGWVALCLVFSSVISEQPLTMWWMYLYWLGDLSRAVAWFLHWLAMASSWQRCLQLFLHKL